MRERPTIPDWAVAHLREQLRPGEEIINAVAFQQGLFSGVVLCNTSKGAAIVAKTLIGAPRSALLTYPRDLLTFRCTACSARNVLVDSQTSDAVYCNHCGREQKMAAEGKATSAARTKAEGAAKTAPKKAAARRKTATATTKAKATPSGTKAKAAAAKTSARSGRCSAKTGAGTRCRNAAQPGKRRCAVHA